MGVTAVVSGLERPFSDLPIGSWQAIQDDYLGQVEPTEAEWQQILEGVVPLSVIDRLEVEQPSFKEAVKNIVHQQGPYNGDAARENWMIETALEILEGFGTVVQAAREARKTVFVG